MAIEPSTYGFPGGSIDAAALPEWVKTARARFSVSGANDWKVTALGSLDRGIKVETGTGHGDGVTVTTHEYETMSLPYPDIATRWYLIARRRNWSGTGTATLVALPGDATASLPAVGNAATQRSNTPGVESDQPIALVRVTQKDRTVQEILNLNAWAGPGGVEVVHRLALGYLAEPGASVKLGSSTWRYEAQANGVWDWREYDAQPRGGQIHVTPNSAGEATFSFAKFPSQVLSVHLTDATGSTDLVVPKVVGLSNGSCTIRTYFGSNGSRRTFPASFMFTATGF